MSTLYRAKKPMTPYDIAQTIDCPVSAIGKYLLNASLRGVIEQSGVRKDGEYTRHLYKLTLNGRLIFMEKIKKIIEKMSKNA